MPLRFRVTGPQESVAISPAISSAAVLAGSVIAREARSRASFSQTLIAASHDAAAAVTSSLVSLRDGYFMWEMLAQNFAKIYAGDGDERGK